MEAVTEKLLQHCSSTSTVSGTKNVSISLWSFKQHVFFPGKTACISSSRGAGWVFAGDSSFNCVSPVDAGAVRYLVSVASIGEVKWSSVFSWHKSPTSFKEIYDAHTPKIDAVALQPPACSSNRIYSLQFLKSQALVIRHRTLLLFSLQIAFVFLCAIQLFHRLVWYISKNNIFVLYLHENADTQLLSLGPKVSLIRSSLLQELWSASLQCTQKACKSFLKSISLNWLA